MERFLDYFVPTDYALDLGINKFTKQMSGVVTIWGAAKAETVKFHAVGIEVDWVAVNGEKWDFEQADGAVTLAKVPQSDLCIDMGYHGALNENMQGAYISTYECTNRGQASACESSANRGKGSALESSASRGGTGVKEARSKVPPTGVEDANSEMRTEVIVATQFESHYAREAFPCIDEPAAKAVFHLKITVPEVGDVVLANTPVEKVKKHNKVPDGKYTVFYDENGKKAAKSFTEYQFEATPRMSTYLLAWVIGHLQGRTVKNAHGTEITTWCAMNQDAASVDFANKVAAKSLEFYDDNFGVAYPLKKLDQVALPDFEAGAMENWGLVTYRESMLLAGENATLSTRKSVALTVAHELSHQWFGDLVTMQWWDDLWLNESFATVMEYYAVDAMYPEFRIFEEFFTEDCAAALRRDALSGVQAVHQEVDSPEEIATLFDPAIVYAKGARLMLMLVRAVGWEKFCEGLKEYFEKYKYNNTVGDDLWGCIAPHAEFDVRRLMHAFIDVPGYPVISVIGNSEAVLRGICRSYDETEGARPPRRRADATPCPRSTASNCQQQRFLLDGPMAESDWPLPALDEDMSGHYIFNLSDEELAERLEKFDGLGLEEKLRLLIDRSLVCKTELAESASLVPLIEKFAHEESAAVWAIVLTAVNGLKMFFEFGSTEEGQFKEWVGRLIEPKLTEVGCVTRADDDENTVRLREILLALDFYAETRQRPADERWRHEDTVLKQLSEMYRVDLGEIDPEVRADVLDAKIVVAPEMFEEYLRLYRESADPEWKFDLLLAMSLVREPEAVTKVLRLLGDLDTVKPQDQFHLYYYLYRNPRAREAAFQWLREHWELVKEFSGDKSLDNYPRYMAGVVRTRAEAEEYRKFFAPLGDDPALKRAIEMGLNEIEANLKLIERGGGGVREAIARA